MLSFFRLSQFGRNKSPGHQLLIWLNGEIFICGPACREVHTIVGELFDKIIANLQHLARHGVFVLLADAQGRVALELGEGKAQLVNAQNGQYGVVAVPFGLATSLGLGLW